MSVTVDTFFFSCCITFPLTIWITNFFSFFFSRNLRGWIEDQNLQYVENGKEARGKLLEVKDKVLTIAWDGLAEK